jgi:hypothetical protein
VIPRRRWEDDGQVGLKEVELQVVGWNDLSRDRKTWWAAVNTVMNLWVL